jgi:hypothetical protein
MISLLPKLCVITHCSGFTIEYVGNSHINRVVADAVAEDAINRELKISN